MAGPKKTPFERALDQIAKYDVQYQATLVTIAVLQQSWQESATEKDRTDVEVAAEARVYGRCIRIAQEKLVQIPVAGQAPQIIRHVRPADMPKTPATQKE